MTAATQPSDAALFGLVQRSFEQTLKACAPSALWSLSQTDSLKSIEHDQCIVLTISSFKFRIMCVLHLSVNENTKRFVAEATTTKPDDLDDTAFQDYLLEMSNSFCGNLKRHLQSSCPPLGMSTPNLLDRSSLDFTNVVDISQSVHANAKDHPDAAPIFAASVLVSLKGNHGFNIPLYQEETNESEADSAGELELF